MISARLDAELGAYYSTLGTTAARATARKHLAAFERTAKRLLERGIIRHRDEIFAIPEEEVDSRDLSALSIGELEILYRQRPLRVKARIAEGREHFTRFLESRIVDELKRRTPASMTERLQKRYCLKTHRIEMENMAAILNLPLGRPLPSPALSPECSGHSECSGHFECTVHSECADHAECSCHSRLCRGNSQPADLHEREALVEAVDLALDSIASASRLQPLAGMMAEIVELNRRGIVRAPEWVAVKLDGAIREWCRRPQVPDTDMVIPLLTMAYINKDRSLERKAQRIINRSYRDCIAGNGTIASFYVASSCSSYVTRYSHRRLSLLWSSSPIDRTSAPSLSAAVSSFLSTPA